jgi:amino acid permease
MPASAPKKPAEQDHAAASTSTSTVTQTSLNLIKNIAGFGALCLPAGIERLSDSGLSSNEALVLGVALLLLFGLLNAWSFLLIGAACVQTGTETYSAAVTATVGPRMARLVTLSSIFICATAAVGCQVVISATLTDVLAFALQTPFEARPALRPRVAATLTPAPRLQPCASKLQPYASRLQPCALRLR